MTLARHLLPEEFDLLVDGESGFGVRELKAHLAACAQCRDEYELLRAFTDEIEALPALTPSPQLTERVMQQVHVFEPWHVALRQTALRFWPERPVTRVLALTAALTSTGVGTAGAVWLWSHRHDLLLGEVARQRTLAPLRSMGGTVRELLVSGAPGAAPLSTPLLLLAAAGVATLAIAAGTYGLRAVAARARRGAP